MAILDHSDTERTTCSIKPRRWLTTTLTPMIPSWATSFRPSTRNGPRHTQARSANGSVPPACKSWRGRPTATFPNCAHMIVGVVASTR
jgi:hypothetical protein